VVLLSSLRSKADTSIRDIPPGEDKIVVVREGDKVPFTGQLYDNGTSLRWANWLFQYKFRLKADVELEKNKCLAETNYLNQVVSVERAKYASVTKDYQGQVAKQQDTIIELNRELQNPPFYKTVWFGLVVGILLTGAAVGAGYALAK